MARRGKHHVIWCTEEQHERVGRLAQRAKLTRSGFLRRILNIGFAEWGRLEREAATALESDVQGGIS